MSNIIQKLKQGSETRSVLIVDDDYDLAHSLRRVFGMFFGTCIVAHDGQEAIDIYKQHLENSQAFSLVVTDLELPKKGGLTFIKEVRQLSKTQDILIISAHDESDFMSEAIALDVKGYILKPVAMPKLFEHLEKILFQSSSLPQEESLTDQVTHWGTSEKLEQFLSENPPEDTILLRIKVNYLSNIYNLIGEEYADEYLKELALVLENLQLDKNTLFYRIGLDELAIILQNQSLQYAKTLARDMVSIARYFHISENGIIINSTLSVGIVQGNQHLLQYSKLALEKSNESGSGFVVSYTQEDYHKNLNITNGREVMKMIYKAIETDSIIPYVQPIIDKKSGKVEIYNSYVRIMQDEKIYSPETFLTIAQNAHQMSMITRSMVKNTFALTQNLEHKDAIVTIHLSNEDFYDESLLPYILFWSGKYNIDPSKVAFEISHIDLSKETQKGFLLLEELKKEGYKFILNNFGLSNYKLASLIEFHPDYIKIHPELLKHSSSYKYKIQTLSTIIDMIHLIGSRVIATHIATKEERELIDQLAVDYIQGYQVCAPYEVKKNDKR